MKSLALCFVALLAVCCSAVPANAAVVLGPFGGFRPVASFFATRAQFIGGPVIVANAGVAVNRVQFVQPQFVQRQFIQPQLINQGFGVSSFGFSQGVNGFGQVVPFGVNSFGGGVQVFSSGRCNF